MYAIWLLPHHDKHKELAQLIINLSQKYNGPCFSPHITLLAGMHGSEKELVIKVSKLAEKMKAFSAKTSAIETQDRFYKSLYLKIAETNPLSRSRQQAETLFHPKQEDGFMPHLSLLYGKQSEQDKQEIMANLKNKTRLDLLIDRVALISANGPPEEWTTVSIEQLC